MAIRRMFSLDITDSDSFLTMPISSQNLYFHLGMRADDDGVVDNPNSIKRMVGSTDDDLKILIAKKFIIPFEQKGIIVIKHWLIHNTIRKDRYTPSKYQEELKMLGLDSNNAYTLLAECDNDYPIIENEPEKPKQLEGARKARYEARKESDLPYSFDYKMRLAFNNKICPVCGVVMKMSNDKTKPTIQHNIPITLGGKHELSNISVICKSCNCSIQNQHITDELNNKEVVEEWNKICGCGNGNQD